MPAYSRTDLATRVLRDSGLIGAEEVPSAPDLEWAIETLSSEISALQVKGIVIWNGNDYSIPIEYLSTLSRRINLAIGPSFGMDSVANVTAQMPLLERDLRILSQTTATGAVLENEFI